MVSGKNPGTAETDNIPLRGADFLYNFFQDAACASVLRMLYYTLTEFISIEVMQPWKP